MHEQRLNRVSCDKIGKRTAIKSHLTLVYNHYQIIDKNSDEDAVLFTLSYYLWECKLVKAPGSQEIMDVAQRIKNYHIMLLIYSWVHTQRSDTRERSLLRAYGPASLALKSKGQNQQTVQHRVYEALGIVCWIVNACHLGDAIHAWVEAIV